MAASLEIVKGADGGLYLVGEVEGAKHVFGSVNASQVSADRIEQEVDEAPANATSAILGAYTGPASDVTASPHLEGEAVSASSSGAQSEPEPESAPESEHQPGY